MALADWPEHLCAVLNRSGFHCHQKVTLLVMPQEPSTEKVDTGRFIRTCDQHAAKAARDLLAQGVGWVSFVPLESDKEV